MNDTAPRILFVDDSEDDTLLAAARLKRALPGASVRRADSPQSMQAALAEGPWDLVICDHAMPCFDSMGALELLKRTGKQIPFIVYSGHYDRDLGFEALRAGVRDYVQKNDPGRLVPVVQRELRRPAAAPDAAGRFDPVTGLAGHPWLIDQADAAIAAAEEGESAIALLRVDLDRFSRINRAFGSPTGDRLMADVAARLKRELAACDLIARGEQDEFLCLLDRIADPAAALRRAERALHALDEPFVREGNAFYVTASAGLAAFPLHGRSAAELFAAAGRAIERARGLGINRAALAPSPVAAAAFSRGLADPIAAGELFVLAHPIVALSSHRTWGLEATARRRSTTFGPAIPDPEAPILPPRPGVETVAAWLVEEALRLAERLRAGGLEEGRVSVNAPPELWTDPDFPARLASRLARAGLAPDAIEIEIAERRLGADPAGTLAAARRARVAGLRIALDDFGTHYGALAPLQSLGADTLKLSPSIVRDLASGDETLRGALALARALGAAVVASGVDSLEVAERLADLGVDRAQGPAFPARRVDAAPVLPARYDESPATQDATVRRVV